MNNLRRAGVVLLALSLTPQSALAEDKLSCQAELRLPDCSKPGAVWTSSGPLHVGVSCQVCSVKGSEVSCTSGEIATAASLSVETPLAKVVEGTFADVGTCEWSCPALVDRFRCYDMKKKAGSLWKAGSSGDPVTWLFDLKSLTWRQLADNPHTVGGYPRTDFDPTTGYVVHRDKGHASSYDPSTDEWTMLWRDGAQSWSDRETGALDPKNQRFFMLGGGALHILDLKTKIYHADVATTGDHTIQTAGAPGFAYWPAANKFVAWSGEPDKGLLPQDVYLLDPTSLVWTRRQPASSNTVVPTNASKWGTYGRFRYASDQDVFVLVNAVDEDVFAIRLEP